jgi:HEAT repeat protein
MPMPEYANRKQARFGAKKTQENGHVGFRHQAANSISAAPSEKHGTKVVSGRHISYGSLVSRLNNSDPEVRRWSAEMLGRLGEKRAVDALVQMMLNDGVVAVRSEAAAALGKLAPTDARDILFPRLDSSYGTPEKKLTVRLLGRLADNQSVEAICHLLVHGDRAIRAEAATALGRIGDIHAVEPLIGAINDPELIVRCNVARSLGKLRDSRGVQPVMFLLSDSEWAVRHEACISLAKLGDKRAVEELIARLQDEHWAVRHRSADALGQIA